MPTYTALWLNAYYDQKMRQAFEAPDIDIALKLASDKYPNPDCKRIHILNDSFWSNEGKICENPHYVPSYQNEPAPEVEGKLEPKPVVGEVTEPSDDTSTDLEPNASKPFTSGWSTFHRVCGWLGIIGGIISFVIGLNERGSDETYFKMLAIILFTAGIGNFFAAFMIDVQTDMRHYLKEIAATQKKMAESFERLEGGEDS